MSKWEEFKSSRVYRLVDLGRPAVFLIPARKLGRNFNPSNPHFGTVQEAIESFLAQTFSAFTVTSIPNFGCWYDGTVRVFDECVQYEVSFDGKEKISKWWIFGKFSNFLLCFYKL